MQRESCPKCATCALRSRLRFTPARMVLHRPFDILSCRSFPLSPTSHHIAFRSLQVLGFLRAAHARRAALGRLRPSGLRVTASCVIIMDPAADIPPEEEVSIEAVIQHYLCYVCQGVACASVSLESRR